MIYYVGVFVVLGVGIDLFLDIVFYYCYLFSLVFVFECVVFQMQF